MDPSVLYRASCPHALLFWVVVNEERKLFFSTRHKRCELMTSNIKVAKGTIKSN